MVGNKKTYTLDLGNLVLDVEEDVFNSLWSRRYGGLPRDLSGKPFLENSVLNDTYHPAIHVPSFRDYFSLMSVFEWGGLRWPDKSLPTEKNFWPEFGENTCIQPCWFEYEKSIACGNKSYYDKNHDWIISPESFYRWKGISSDVISEIELFFDPIFQDYLTLCSDDSGEKVRV